MTCRPNLTTVNDRMKILCQRRSFIPKELDFCTKMKYPPLHMVFGGGWSWPALPCGLAKPVISTSQGCISDVLTVPKCPQRNTWWIYDHLRAQIEILPSYLHRPGSHQYSHSCFRVFVTFLFKFFQLPGRIWNSGHPIVGKVERC